MAPRLLSLALLALLSFLPFGVSASIVVLIHGYLGEGDNWRTAGITDDLVEAGWTDGGDLAAMDGGIRSTARPPAAEAQVFYTLRMPSDAPLLTQAEALTQYVRAIRRHHPEQPLILVGHSAGGVVARLFLVQEQPTDVQALITFASPHLGTDTAEIGLMITESPAALLEPLLGDDTFSRSRRLYADLVRERPGTTLYWLNRQPHPNLRYVSVVRSGEALLSSDLMVPAESQDMNKVPALVGRSEVFRTEGGHELGPSDGALLVRLLREGERV